METTDALRVIGVVDLFGFEVFKNNSLEQLCINFANEKLQALFTKCVFKETIAAYATEGIQADEITFKDNKDLIEMFEQPKTGMWAVLNEECVVPKGTDKGFTEKLLEAHKKNAEVIATVKGKSAGEGFCIKHFAGDVTYSTGSWLNKNKDPLNGDLMVLMQFSDNAVLKEMFSAEAAPPGAGGKFKSNKFKGIITAFCTGLEQLYTVLDSSALHFVRCFKPNDAKTGGLWAPETVTRQLHTSGVLDALRVARTGYPDRMPFEEFNGMYSFVGGLAKGAGDHKGKCADLCAKLKLTGKDFKLGREKIFLALGVKGTLNALRNQAMAGVAGKLQASARGMNARGKVRVMREARGEKCEAMREAIQGNDVELLGKAIKAAKAIGVGKSKFDEPGKRAIAGAMERLAELEKLAVERKAAELALTKLTEAAISSSGTATALDGELASVKAAIVAARATGVPAAVVAAGEAKLKRLLDEQKRRAEEEERRRQEELRLSQLKESKAREAEEKRMEEERNKRDAAAAAKVLADTAAAGGAKEAAAEAEVQAGKDAERNAAMAEKNKAAAEVREAEEAEQRALEEEAVRLKVLAELVKSGTVFRSAPEDVLEYAVYLGMQLDEDKELLWIADQALQAEDPEGWSQCESPNGDLYYVNQVTMQVLWQHPLDYQYQQTYLEEKKKIMASGGGSAAKGKEPASPATPSGDLRSGKGADAPAGTTGAPPSDGGKVSDDQLH